MLNESILNPIVYKNGFVSTDRHFRPISLPKEISIFLRTALRRGKLHKTSKGTGRVGEAEYNLPHPVRHNEADFD